MLPLWSSLSDKRRPLSVISGTVVKVVTKDRFSAAEVLAGNASTAAEVVDKVALTAFKVTIVSQSFEAAC